MKRCPTCQKEFPDSMRFCQTDGTPLVEVADKATAPPPPPPDPYKTVVGGQIKMDADMLDIPDNQDPMKTMVSPISIPKADPPKSDPPKPANDPFSAPPPPLPKVESKSDAPPKPGTPSFGDSSPKSDPPKFDAPKNDPPPSPFGSPFSNDPPKSDSPFGKSSGSGSSSSSPFDKPASQQSSSPFDKAPPPPYKEPEPKPKFDSGVGSSSPFGASSSPFDSPSSKPVGQQQNDWTPPAPPVAGWQDQGLGANTPFQPPPAGGVGGGENKTLAIVSLVLGILSLPCCSWYIFGIAALITGFIAKGKAESDPATYGGRGMALAGLAMGAISLVLGVIVTILYFLGAFAGRL